MIDWKIVLRTLFLLVLVIIIAWTGLEALFREDTLSVAICFLALVACGWLGIRMFQHKEPVL